MDLILTRLDWTDKGIFGHLFCEGFDCVTLENHKLYIPEGKYKITLYNSPHFMKQVPLLHDVSGRDSIEIHCGNWEYESKGCILVGKERDGFSIDSSKDTFNDLMTILKKADEIWLTIK